jgi:hypothetical protein
MPLPECQLPDYPTHLPRSGPGLRFGAVLKRHPISSAIGSFYLRFVNLTEGSQNPFARSGSLARSIALETFMSL